MPELAKECTGFFTVAFTDELSPKFHDHDVGVLVELSVNVTVNGGGAGSRGAGEAGDRRDCRRRCKLLDPIVA